MMMQSCRLQTERTEGVENERMGKEKGVNQQLARPSSFPSLDFPSVSLNQNGDFYDTPDLLLEKVKIL